MGNAEASLEDAEKAIKIKPDWPKAQFRKGLALQCLDRHEEALKAFYACMCLEDGGPGAKPAKAEVTKEIHHLLTKATSDLNLERGGALPSSHWLATKGCADSSDTPLEPVASTSSSTTSTSGKTSQTYVNDPELEKVMKLSPTLKLLSNFLEVLYAKGECNIEDLPQNDHEKIAPKDDGQWLLNKVQPYKTAYR